MNRGKRIILTVLTALAVLALSMSHAGAQAKPNILFIMPCSWLTVAFLLLAFGPGQVPASAQDLGARPTEALYTPEDAADFLARPWKFNIQPMYERKSAGGARGYCSCSLTSGSTWGSFCGRGSNGR